MYTKASNYNMFTQENNFCVLKLGHPPSIHDMNLGELEEQRLGGFVAKRDADAGIIVGAEDLGNHAEAETLVLYHHAAAERTTLIIHDVAGLYLLRRGHLVDTPREVQHRRGGLGRTRRRGYIHGASKDGGT